MLNDEKQKCDALTYSQSRLPPNSHITGHITIRLVAVPRTKSSIRWQQPSNIHRVAIWGETAGRTGFSPVAPNNVSTDCSIPAEKTQECLMVG